jgi:hypothetical protein
MGDASISFFSKYQSDWKDNLRNDGYDMTDVDYGGDSLSQKYNIMVVPVNIKASKLSNYCIEIVNTFWIGACNSFNQPNFSIILILHLCKQSKQVMMLTISIMGV